MRNDELIRDIATAIRENPRNYDQTAFGRITGGCHTHACIAGHALLESGYVLVQLHRGQDAVFFDSNDVPVPAGRIPEIAAELMGIEGWEINVLFASAWRPAAGLDVPEALEKYAAGDSLYQISSTYVRSEIPLEYQV